MLSTTSSLTAAQRSQQQWEKKKQRNNNNLSSSSTSRTNNNHNHNSRPLDLAWRSPYRPRLFGGPYYSTMMMPVSTPRYQGGAIVVTDDEETTNSHHRQNSTTISKNIHPSRKMYLSPQMMITIQTEIETLPLPATLASVALTLLNSTLLWDVHDNNDDDDDDTNRNNIVNNNMKEDSTNFTTNNSNKSNNNDADNLSKYFSGITINDEQQQRQQKKIQFDNLCKGLITKGNHVMLFTWEEVQDRLGEEFIFARLTSSSSDDDAATTTTVVDSEGGAAAAAAAAAAAVEEGSDAEDTLGVAAVIKEVTPTSSPPPPPPSTTNKWQHHRQQHYHRGNNNLKKSIPKKSHPTSPKPTQRRHNIKLKQVIKRVAHGAKRKANMGLDAYKQMMLDRMGKSKYNLMFQQATMSPTKDLKVLLDDSAKSLDDKIQQAESSRRKTKQELLLERAEQERQARESASKLLRPLTPDEAQIVKMALYGHGPKSQVLASQGADSVQRDSMQTLQPGQWLNDEVINYFLKNCLAKRDEMLCAKQPGRKRSHFFNSFFVQTMFDDKNDNFDLRGRYNYKNVRRWSKKVPGKDIFNLKYIFCPINLDNMHWTSACIFMEEKKIQYFDSLGGSERGKLKGLLQYLKDEWKAKKGGEMDVSEWKLVGCQEDTPRQKNGEAELVV
eukprot:scaffold376_cov137-Skeletonema_menzelii.AAC.8